MQRPILFVMLFLSTLPAITEGARPNIAFILADDLGYGDSNTYGGDRCQIETPHIDALAKGGLKYTDAHVNAPVCGPTRADYDGPIPVAFWKISSRWSTGIRWTSI